MNLWVTTVMGHAIHGKGQRSGCDCPHSSMDGKTKLTFERAEMLIPMSIL